MLNNILPEQAGIETSHVRRFLESLEKRRLPMHSLLLMRSGSLFLEAYWKPFAQDQIHRMYSVTKSFVSVGVGLAEEDGLIDLDRPVCQYFPEKISHPLAGELQTQTVRQMLTMTTAGISKNWFQAAVTDRTCHYFKPRDHYRPAGTHWQYDSPGTQVLCALVEKVTGKKLLDYLKERIFSHTGGFTDAKMLKIGNGDSWGDSALICTSRDLMLFAQFVMNHGLWNGKRLMNEQYLKTATSRLQDNSLASFGKLYSHGYGYQFWRTEKDGFAMVGMGGQLAVCLPQQDLIMVCTADLQGNNFARDYIIAQFMDLISDNLKDRPVAEIPEETEKLRKLISSLELCAIQGQPDSPMASALNGVRYDCLPNPLGWHSFTLQFNDMGGSLCYKKDSGEKELPFYLNRNCFCKFPEEGYSREFGGQITTDGSKYDAAVSAAWVQEDKLMLYIQVIDEYFGNLLLELSFKDDQAVVTALKHAENFMNDYNGEAVAIRSSQ